MYACISAVFPQQYEIDGREVARSRPRIATLQAFFILLLFAFSNLPVRADSVVVFNEVMYHPADDTESFEWVELYNQLAVDVDLSRWFLTDGIEFSFPENTVIPGRGYLLVATSPPALSAATGLTNILGPYTGRLSNSGETLELRNANGRLMDRLKYGVEDPWPAAADGAGVSLAKRDQEQATLPAENWTVSALRGGTPGKLNFALKPFELTTTIPLPATNTWNYELSGQEAEDWQQLTFNDSTWLKGSAPFRSSGAPLPAGDFERIPSLFNTGTGPDGKPLSPGMPDPHYWLTESAKGQPPPPPIRATIIQNHPAWLANDLSSTWIGPVNPGTTDVAAGKYVFMTEFDLAEFDPSTASLSMLLSVDNTLQNVFLNGVARGIAHSGFAGWSSTFEVTSGFLAATNRLEFATVNEGDAPNPAGFRVQVTGTARKQFIANTQLASTPVTSYFRSPFLATGPLKDSAFMIRALVSDGALFYVNGQEVWRVNMPSGPVTSATLAKSNVLSPEFQGPFTIPSAVLLPGTNMLAVEVHSASGTANDLLFATELSLQITNILVPRPVTLSFNEVASATNADFWVELVNHGSEAINLEGITVARRGSPTPRDYTFANQVLSAGAFLVVPRSTLGFSADPGDRLFLYRADGSSVLDAVIAKRNPRARHPDGSGRWLYPSALTPGQSNQFNLQSDIVFNEIHYHPPDLPSSPELVRITSLIAMTNVWRYHCLGEDLGMAWRQPSYQDQNWPAGRGVLYNTPAFLPAPKGTELPLLVNGEPIRTFYFRTTFTSTTNAAELNLRPLLDDGAVYYLNGREIFRQNMSSGGISYRTLASAGVATADFTGPFTIPTTNLVVGTNVLAVEVHQFTTNHIAADVVFGMDLFVEQQLSPPLPSRESPGQWLELFNRGTNTVNLAGWSITGDVEAQFESGTSMAPGEYLIVPADPLYMASNYPGLNLATPFTGKLSRRSGFLSLRDVLGNPVNELRYFEGGRWPEYADGGGASLELRDPRSDNSQPESWAASRPPWTPWTQYSYRAVARNELGPTLWNEFVIGLLDAGEYLIDDLSVIESPASAPVQMLQNGSFSTGLTAWRTLGNHSHSRVMDDPDQPGNKVLHLVSTGPAGHLHNHLETTLTGGRSVVVGREYLISFRAKWLVGNNRLNTRLYFNRLAKTFPLERPLLFGTPGTANSVFTPNAGPSFANLRHGPVLPLPNQPITVSVEAADPDGLSSVALRWRLDGGNWQSTPMETSGLGSRQGYTGYAAVLPAQSAGRLIQFFVEATDAKGAGAFFPRNGADSRALIKIDEGKPLMTQLHTIRMWMTSADAALLHAPTNVMSDDHLKLTVVYNDREVFYDAGIHLQGSQRGRNDSSRLGFHLRFNDDQLFRGLQNNLAMDRSGGTTGIGGKHEEILLWQAVNHAGGILGIDCDLVQIFAPRTQDDSTALLRMSAFDSDYFDNQFPGGSDGERFKLELIYYPLTSLDGDPEAPKLPQPDEVINPEIQDRGSDPEPYRWIWRQENKADDDNYARLVAMNQAFSLSTSILPEHIHHHIDVDQWMRTLAFKAFTGDPDTFTYGLNHHWQVYFPPAGGPALGMLWDMDLSFYLPVTNGFPGSGSPNTYRIIMLPDSLRRYYHHLQDIAASTVNAEHIGPWAKHYGTLLGQDWSALTQYLQERTDFILSKMPANAPFALTSNGGKGFATNAGVALLSGTAPLNLRDIQMNGLIHRLTWTSFSNWTLAVPLASYSNFLVLQGLDGRGQKLQDATVSVVITNLSLQPLSPVKINEWLADNIGPGGLADPLDGAFSDWFELFNPNGSHLDLSGYYLTDTLSNPVRWQIPAGTLIAPNGFLLVWADGQPEQNGLGVRGELHADFQLSRAGESIALFDPSGALQHSVTFGPQLPNISQGLFPDGQGNIYSSMEDWTPGAPNRLGPPPSPEIAAYDLNPDGELELTCTVLPLRSYRIEYSDSLLDAAWLPLHETLTATGSSILIRDRVAAEGARYYRLLLLK